MEMGNLTGADVFNSLSNLGKTYVQAKYAPGSLSAPPANQASDGSLHDPSQAAPVSASNPWAQALAPIGQAYAAHVANKDLNANPPYWLYGLIGLGLVGLYIVVRR